MKDEILIKFLLKESNLEEKEEVNKWLALGEDNVIYLAQMRKIWVESKKLSAKSKVDVEAAWIKFKDSTSIKPKVKLGSLNIWMRIAAVFVLAIGSWVVTTSFRQPFSGCLSRNRGPAVRRRPWSRRSVPGPCQRDSRGCLRPR